MQHGKEHNVRRVASFLDGSVLAPGARFSHHALVGRPTIARGFLPGPEMHDEALVPGVGGGACAVSNLVHLVALRAGMKILERHRHGLDLFPDHGRTAPFASGATVFYNQADLRFENPLGVAVMLRLIVDAGGDELIGEVRAAADPGYRFAVYETDHRFRRDGELTIRENRLRRRVTRPDGTLVLDEELCHNVARVRYDVDIDIDADGGGGADIDVVIDGDIGVRR